MKDIITIVCDDCSRTFQVRRPHNFERLISSILKLVKCPTCHPEALAGMCSACRLPLSLLRPIKKWGGGKSGFHADLCFACYQRERREKKALSVTTVP